MPTSTDTLAADAAHLGDLKTAVWDAIRAMNDSHYALAECQAWEAANAALAAGCEDFRRKHFPRAIEVFAVCDHTIGQRLSVWRRTPSGRAVEAWSA